MGKHGHSRALLGISTIVAFVILAVPLFGGRDARASEGEPVNVDSGFDLQCLCTTTTLPETTTTFEATTTTAEVTTTTAEVSTTTEALATTTTSPQSTTTSAAGIVTTIPETTTTTGQVSPGGGTTPTTLGPEVLPFTGSATLPLSILGLSLLIAGIVTVVVGDRSKARIE